MGRYRENDTSPVWGTSPGGFRLRLRPNPGRRRKKKDDSIPDAYRINAPLLVAEVARFYKWQVDYILNMPARTFFSMLKSGRQLKNQEYYELCDLMWIPASTPKYKEELQEYYQYNFNWNHQERKNTDGLKDDEAYYALMGMLQPLKV